MKITQQKGNSSSPNERQPRPYTDTKKRLIKKKKKALINDTANKVWNVQCTVTVINNTVLYT